MIFIIIVLSVFLGDFLLKRYMEQNLAEGETKSILGGKILIQKVHNKGVALGFLSEYPTFVRKGTLGLIGILAIYFVRLLFRKGGTGKKAGAALLLGGSLCNWFDRFHQGYVTDYFSFQVKWKRLRQIVFNLSDLCIFLGMIFLLFGGRKKRN